MKFFSGSTAFLILVIGSASFKADALPDLAPPKVQLVDEFGVNVHNGQVQSSLETVSIGGPMGLSHSISNYSNNFLMSGYRGYHDKYYVNARVTELDTRPGRYKNVLRVQDIDGSSADFELIVGGAPTHFAVGNPVYVASYSYRALGDKRHTLETRSDGVYWTKPDGTEVKFNKGNAGYPEQVGFLRQIKYPNGFIIDVDYLNKRVTTNTGFALKYIHEPVSPGDWLLDPSKTFIQGSEIPAINPDIWASRNPRYVQAINLKKENCLTSVCQRKWPQVEFVWPKAMPRSFYIGDSVFKVIDAEGGITEYYFRSFDLAYNGTTLYEHSVPNRNFSPRLIGIKPAGATAKVFQYTYKNIFTSYSSDGSTWFFSSSDAGEITNAKKINATSSYSIGQTYYDSIQNNGGGFIQRVLPKVDAYPGAINSVTTRDGTINYELNYRNFPISYQKYSQGYEVYEYDNRGNMKKVTKNGTWTTAEYPSDCVSTPRAFCNKPIWTSDAKNNKTWFTYHPSGEIETITYPANKNGIVQKIRYEYTEFPASYYSSNGSSSAPVSYSAPLVLKTAERTCATSNTTGNSCAVINDEIITRYEYESDNLYLTGVTVDAYDPVSKKRIVKRTCYEYDSYGNKIGETQPKENLTYCARQ